MLYQKGLEKLRILILLKLIVQLPKKNHEYYKLYLSYCCQTWSCNSCQLASLSIFLLFALCVCAFFTRWPGCWANACSGSLPLDFCIFNCVHCISIHCMSVANKVLSLSLSLSLSIPGTLSNNTSTAATVQTVLVQMLMNKMSNKH